MKTATRFPRPTVAVSRCLCGARCRWDGDSSPSSFVKELKQHARVIPVCPEIEIGLGVPRERIVLVRRGQGVELYQPSSGLRLAQKMRTFTRRFLEGCSEIDGFILKHKSPSCGLRSAKLYWSTTPNAASVRKGVGIFAAEAVRLCPHAAFEDEERLDSPAVRELFLTHLFTTTAWRGNRRYQSASALAHFHDYHRLMFGVYNQRLACEMDRIAPGARAQGRARSRMTATPGARRMSTSAAIDRYEKLLRQILEKKPRRSSQIRPFELALEHYSPFLSASDQKQFQRRLREFTDGMIALSEIRTTVQIWAVRYDKNFIREHSFFRPYPGLLAEA